MWFLHDIGCVYGHSASESTSKQKLTVIGERHLILGDQPTRPNDLVVACDSEVFALSETDLKECVDAFPLALDGLHDSARSKFLGDTTGIDYSNVPFDELVSILLLPIQSEAPDDAAALQQQKVSAAEEIKKRGGKRSGGDRSVTVKKKGSQSNLGGDN